MYYLTLWNTQNNSIRTLRLVAKSDNQAIARADEIEFKSPDELVVKIEKESNNKRVILKEL